MQILLDFQIKSRDKFLKNFSNLFKKCDGNNDGLLNESEFDVLLSHLLPYNDQIEENRNRYLNQLDSYNSGTVNFSDTVNLFTNVNKLNKIKEVINEVDEFGNRKKSSLLDKICTDENFMENLQTSTKETEPQTEAEQPQEIN